MVTLHHLTSWEDVSHASSFTLHPGPQGAQGVGVYWSVDRPVRPTTAEGLRVGGEMWNVVATDFPIDGWRKGKESLAKKFGKPVAWNSDGKNCLCHVVDRDNISRTVYVRLTFERVEK